MTSPVAPGFYQVRRAFHHIFWSIVGGSLVAARLRAAVWESIFTHDMRRYRRALVDRMGDMTTLIVGPSGTGKELVARAIALSRHVPFDPESGRFAEHGPAIFTLVYADTGSYQETARRLGIDRRTVRSKVDREQAEALRRASGSLTTPAPRPS